MKIVIVLIAALIALNAHAESMSFRLPTKEELVASFNRSYQAKLAYYKASSDPKFNDSSVTDSIAADATPEKIEVLADWTLKTMNDEAAVCEQKKIQFPKVKEISCYNAVVMTSGLDLPDELRSTLNVLNNKGLSLQALRDQKLRAINNKEIAINSKLLKIGIGGKDPRSKGTRLTEHQLTEALGRISLLQWSYAELEKNVGQPIVQSNKVPMSR